MDFSDYMKKGFQKLHNDIFDKNYKKKSLLSRKTSLHLVRRQTRDTLLSDRRNLDANISPFVTPMKGNTEKSPKKEEAPKSVKNPKPVKASNPVKAPKPVNERYKMLRQWKEQRNKLREEEKKKSKPVFKVYHLDKPIGLPNLEFVNKQIKGKLVPKLENSITKNTFSRDVRVVSDEKTSTAQKKICFSKPVVKPALSIKQGTIKRQNVHTVTEETENLIEKPLVEVERENVENLIEKSPISLNNEIVEMTDLPIDVSSLNSTFTRQSSRRSSPTLNNKRNGHIFDMDIIDTNKNKKKSVFQNTIYTNEQNASIFKTPTKQHRAQKDIEYKNRLTTPRSSGRKIKIKQDDCTTCLQGFESTPRRKNGTSRNRSLKNNRRSKSLDSLDTDNIVLTKSPNAFNTQKTPKTQYNNLTSSAKKSKSSRKSARINSKSSLSPLNIDDTNVNTRKKSKTAKKKRSLSQPSKNKIQTPKSSRKSIKNIRRSKSLDSLDLSTSVIMEKTTPHKQKTLRNETRKSKKIINNTDDTEDVEEQIPINSKSRRVKATRQSKKSEKAVDYVGDQLTPKNLKLKSKRGSKNKINIYENVVADDTTSEKVNNELQQKILSVSLRKSTRKSEVSTDIDNKSSTPQSRKKSKKLVDVYEQFSAEDNNKIERTPNSGKKLNLLQEDKERTPLTEELTRSSRAPYISPFVTISRGKDSARKEYKTRKSQGGTLVETPDGRNFSKNTAPEAGAVHFEKLLNEEISKIKALCMEWDNYKNENVISDDINDMINVVIGQSNLLITKKFEQFRSLIKQCQTTIYDEKPVTCEDLHGFWDMIYFQVLDLNKRFDNLNRLKNSNWEEIVPERKVEKRKVGRPKKRIAPSSIRNAIKAAREKIKQAQDNSEVKIVNYKSSEDEKMLTPIKTSNGRRSLRVSVLQKSASKRLSSPGLTMMKITQSIKAGAGLTPNKSILKLDSGKSSKSSKKSVLFRDGGSLRITFGPENKENSAQQYNIVNEDTIVHDTPRKSKRLSKM